MRNIAFKTLACALAFGCVTARAEFNPYGQFVMAAPTSAAAPELSMRWRFGLALATAPEEIDEIKFSCSSLPGSTITVKLSDMQRKNAEFYIDGPITPVSNKSTPWLFAPSLTQVTCNATIHTIWNTLGVISTRLNYTEEMKAETLQKLKAAYESSRQIKKP